MQRHFSDFSRGENGEEGKDAGDPFHISGGHPRSISSVSVSGFSDVETVAEIIGLVPCAPGYGMSMCAKMTSLHELN